MCLLHQRTITSKREDEKAVGKRLMQETEERIWTTMR